MNKKILYTLAGFIFILSQSTFSQKLYVSDKGIMTIDTTINITGKDQK